MKRPRLLHLRLLALLSGWFLLAATSRADAQESLVGLGKVYSNGVIESSASPIGATITSLMNSTGNYTLTFALNGAFAGATADDFVIESTLNFVNPGDRAINAAVIAVNDNLLSVRVRTADVEDATIPDLGVEASAAFVFVVRRLDLLTAGSPITSRHLLATGSVQGDGTIDHAFAVDGISLLSGRGNTGSYFLQLDKPGAFTTDDHDQYLLILSSRSIALPDVAIRGRSYNAIPDDRVTFYINTDDVQAAPASNTQIPANASFAFAIYRVLPEDLQGQATTSLIAAIASIDGATGDLVSHGSAFPGATLNTIRIDPGRYRVFIHSPGAFSGIDAGRFAPLVHLNDSNLSDEIAKTRTVIVDADTMRFDVTIDDVQHFGDSDGIPADASFFLTIYDASPVLRHDLHVGARASGTDARGQSLFNLTGAGQSLNLTLREKQERSAYFRSVNAGRTRDDLQLRTGKISSRVDARLFATTGIRRNITAATRIGATVETGLLPGAAVAVQATLRYRNLEKRPRSTMTLRSLSGYQPGNQDLNRVSLRPH